MGEEIAGVGVCPVGYRLTLPLWCPEGGTEPQRHLFALPRGRGPSQTPKFLSPGPPSPWLPALLIGNLFMSFWRRTVGSAPGDARGVAPCMKKTLASPFPPGRGAGGIGAGNKAKGRVCRRQGRHAPAGRVVCPFPSAARVLLLSGTTAAKTRNRAHVPIPGNRK